MRLGTLDIADGVLHPVTRPEFHRWVAYGPGAGRVALTLATSPVPQVRALNFLAQTQRVDPLTLAHVADHWLTPVAEPLLDRAPRLLLDPASFRAAAPLTGPWLEPWAGQDASEFLLNTTHNSPVVEQLAMRAPGVTPAPAAYLTEAIFSQWREQPDFRSVGTHTAMLALQAEGGGGEETPQTPPAPVARDQLKVAAGVLGAGAAGLVGAALAHSVGLGALGTLGAGGVAGAAALWVLTKALPNIDIRPTWDLFAGVVNKAVDGIIDFLKPGQQVPNTDAGEYSSQVPATAMLGQTVTSNIGPIRDSLVAALWAKP